MHLEIKLHPLVAEFRVTKPVAFFQKSLMRPVTPSIQALQFDRKQLRLIKNRQAADLSRRKKKEEMEYLKKRVAELELKVYELETKNMTLELENSKFRGKSAGKDFVSSDIPVYSSPGTVSNDIFTDLQFNYQSSNPPSPQSDSTLDNEQKLFDSLFNFDASESIKGVFSVSLF